MPSNSASKVKKAPSNTLKQGTLGFTTTKRTGSATLNAKDKKPVRAPSSESAPSKRRVSDGSNGNSTDGAIIVEAEASEREDTHSLRPTAIDVPEKQTSSLVSPRPEVVERELPELDISDPRWRKQHNAAVKQMGTRTPIHAENQNKVHEILRVFDLSYKYGPCVGVSRLDRWKRAHALGLNPPEEIRDILSTKQGMTQVDYVQPVFEGEV